MLDFNLYQSKCTRTWRGDGSDRYQLLNCALGLGESGEVQNIIKKWVFHGHELDGNAIADELGDILFYVAMTAKLLNIPLADVAEGNVEKLMKRYPSGFSEESSRNRLDIGNDG